jgi:hypothetical protein
MVMVSRWIYAHHYDCCSSGHSEGVGARDHSGAVGVHCKFDVTDVLTIAHAHLGDGVLLRLVVREVVGTQ